MHMKVLLGTLALATLACNESRAPTESPDAAPAPKMGTAPSYSTTARKMLQVTANVVAPAPHNPRSQVGQPVACFDGTTDGGFGGTCKRFLPTKDGAELQTNGGNPNGEYAGVFGAQGLRLKKLANVTALTFSYAGGPIGGGAPRWSIPIDENNDGKRSGDEQYAFVAGDRCNDGDTPVALVDARHDATCLIDHKGVTYANWNDFATQHPTWKIAGKESDGTSNAFTFVIADAPTHLVVWNVRSQ